MYKHAFHRHKTREVGVGNLVIGGDNPIIVQSMTTPDTNNIAAVLAEIHRLEEAGCEMVRVTVPKPEDAAVLGEIKKRIKIPLIVDIHFDHKMALAALDHPIDKISCASTPATSAAWIAFASSSRRQGQGHPDAHRRQRRQPRARIRHEVWLPLPSRDGR